MTTYITAAILFAAALTLFALAAWNKRTDDKTGEES